MNEVDNDVFCIELNGDYPRKNINQLRKREGEMIKKLNPKLNMQVKCRNNSECFEDNKQSILSRNKNYYEEKKKEEHFNAWKRHHYQESTERINKQRKIYMENNKEKIND